MTWKPRRLSPLERRAALQPQPMTPEQVADLVERARVSEELARAEGVAKQVAARKATLEAKRSAPRKRR